jgi:hypothetical protein
MSTLAADSIEVGSCRAMTLVIPKRKALRGQRRGDTWSTRRMNAEKKWPNFARLVAVYE